MAPRYGSTQIHEFEGLSDRLEELFKKSCHNNQLPWYAKDSIRARLVALNTLLDTYEVIIARHSRGSGSQSGDEDRKP